MTECLELEACVDVVSEEDVEDGAEEVVCVAEQEEEHRDGQSGLAWFYNVCLGDQENDQ